MRRILAYALAAFLAAFLWVILLAPSTHAADATWKGTVIQYGGNDYNGPASAKTVKDLALLDGTKAYTYIEPAATTAGSASSAQRKIHVVYFASGVDSSVATGAKYKTYIYQGPSSFSDPTSPTDISIAKQSTSANPGTSSCDVDSGVGWMICPITNFLAKRMDNIFNLLSGFLAVRPTETGQDTAMFRAWTYMRSFANVAFVIAFLIIIYSQLTNVGITNYSIKKLLPRLIIAALLVNLSYYICSIAVDLSNILGYSIQDVFIQLRNSLVGTEGNSWNITSWESITSFILSGGTLATAGTIGLIATLSTYGVAGSIILLLPALVTALIAVLVALVVMAARQALITILIIIAPLAFVAYLLPNTDKWFDKWRSVFMTMLILFPAFSVVFGGSQLAAAAIIQNADSINLIILGMLVQVAPLFITPLLIRLSGSLLGRIAGMVNNPNKGLIDRTKNFSKDRADNLKAKRLAEVAKPGRFLRKNAQRVDHNRRKREGQRKIHEGMTDNNFTGSHDGEALHHAQHGVETEKKTIEERLSRDLSMKIQVDPEMREKEMKMRITTDESALHKAKVDKIYEGMRAGVDPTRVGGVGGVLKDLTERSEEATRDLALTSIATQSAKRVQQVRLSDALIKNQETIDGISLRDYAGGIDTDNGSDSALAFAVSQKHEAEVKLVNERTQLIKQFKLNGEERQDLAMGKQVVQGKYKIGTTEYTYDFTPADTFARDAAIDMQMGIGSVKDIKEILQNSGGSLKDYRKTISEAISTKGVPGKMAWTSGVFIDKVLRGEIVDETAMEREIVNTYIVQGKIKPEVLATNDPISIRAMISAISGAPRTSQLNAKLDDLKNTIGLILDEDGDMHRATSEASRAAFRDLVGII
ncbi:hypothetical protein H7X68_01630 [Candidatus Saccharibacteria bacterium]|nr:hypothetical protein [Candidatus Saccharibacteria bacterium]